jgi:hypothetical protein
VSIARSTYRAVGLWDRRTVLSRRASDVCTVWVPLYRSCVCVVGLRRPPSPSLPMPAPVPRPTPTSPNPITLPLPLPATALVRFRRASHTAAAAAPVWGRAPRWNTETDLTPPAAATLSRDPTRFGRLKIRGSPGGSAGSRPYEFGAIRPCFFQRFTVKGSQWVAAGVRVAVWVQPWVGGKGSQQ